MEKIIEYLQVPEMVHDRILIEKMVQGEQRTKGGILIPENADNELSKGIVISVGQGRIFSTAVVPLYLKVGDVVRFNERASTEFTEQGTKYISVKETDVVSVVGRIKQKVKKNQISKKEFLGPQ